MMTMGGVTMGSQIMERKKKTLIVAALVVTVVFLGLGLLSTLDLSEGDDVIHDYAVTYDPNHDDEDHKVHRSDGTEATTVIAQYDGIISTEYNPEHWVVAENKQSTPGNLPAKDTGDVALKDWIGPTYQYSANVKITVSGSSCTITLPSTSDTNSAHSNYAYSFESASTATSKTLDVGVHTVTIYFTAHKVFGGWTDITGAVEYFPGDVIPNTLASKTLKAKWIDPDIFSKRLSVSENTTLSFNDLPHTYYIVQKSGNNKITFDNGSYKDNNEYLKAPNSSGTDEFFDIKYGNSRSAPSMYATIYLFKTSASNDVDYYTYESDRAFPSGTYRSDPANTYLAKFNVGPSGGQGKAKMYGNAIFDTIGLKANDSGKHGAGANGLYGMGNALILGTGIKMDGTSTQVIGGRDSSFTTSSMTKTMVFASGNSGVPDTTADYDLATCLIIHSGVYYNVMAGNSNGTIGNSSNYRSTYLVFKGGMVLDTLFGGSGGQTNRTITAANSTSTFTRETGGTFAYITGAFMPADCWVDKQTYYKTGTTYEQHATEFTGLGSNTVYRLNDTSVINGGSNKSLIVGTSHVFITDHAVVYDVTGAGREKESVTGYSYLEVSGKAMVRHAACGGVMNGIEDNARQLVDNTHVKVLGDCKIASVFGAGYDIWAKPAYSSMTDGGNITIEMSGGTVTDIYGGGYRGTVGSEGKPVHISINVSGGTIEGSIYGGGSGGVNKFKHDANGYKAGDQGKGQPNTTGYSYVYGDVTVNVSGGLVTNNVYGGGKSLPALTYYKGDTFSENNRLNVAQVIGNTHVNVSGTAEILGSVYGAGRGVEWEYDTDTKQFSISEDMSRTKLMTGTGSTSIDWYVKDNSTITWDLSSDMIRTVDPEGSIKDGFAGNYLTFAHVAGDSEVKVSGGTVRGSVFGGGSYGIVQSKTSGSGDGNTYVEITGGKIVENVYGGGLGIEGVVSVTGARTVFINYSTVDPVNNLIGGSVYGSSSIGDDGDKSHFPENERDYLEYIQSNNPTDSTVIIEKAMLGTASSQDSSVFGGGFMGKTYGEAFVYIGYHYEHSTKSISPYKGTEPKTISMNSIYGGGNVTTSGGTVKDPYTQDLVMGNSKVFIYGNGQNGDVTIKGSIMGSGNSCNTRWSTDIEISSLENKYIVDEHGNKSNIEGIHRATNLTISQSILDISSRSTLTPVADSPSKDLSIFNIHNMVLKYDTSLIIRAPVDYIGSYHSLSKDSNPTTMTSPSNKITYTSGSTVYVREMVNDSLTYGRVEGYTVLEASSTGTSGAYVIADQLASGGSGFVVAKEGTYKEADFTTSSASGVNLKCWFISGTQSKVVTMNMPYKNDELDTVKATIDIAKLQSGTKMRYTGATLTSVSTDNEGNSFEFVRPGTEEYGYQFGMIIGYSEGSAPGADTMRADTQRYLKIGESGGEYYYKWVTGTYYSDDPSERSGSSEPMRGEETSPARTIVPLAPVEMTLDSSNAGTYKLNLLFTGKPQNTTMYIGYMTINLQEINEVAYEATDSQGHLVTYINTMVTNNINIRVDLYVIGTGDVTKASEYKVVLRADDDKEAGSYEGYTEIIIPTGFLMGKLVLEDVSTQNIANGQSITVTAYKNQDNTTGWMTINSAVKWTKGKANDTEPTIGTMSGTVVATIRYSIQDFSYPSLEEGQYPQFTLHFKTTIKDGTVVPSDVTVIIQKKPMHTVTYHDSFNDVTGTARYSDGTYITANSWKTMGTNFIGWYTDPDFVNMFDYSTPITKDIDLYARFSFVVTFDYMDGTKTDMYIAADKNGALLNKARVPSPTKAGYNFNGWYKDSRCIVEWDYAFDSVSENIILYAKWTGIQAKVNFLYWDDSNEEWTLFNGTETPASVTNATLIGSITEVGDEFVDMFGNTYTRSGSEPYTYTLKTESLFNAIDSDHERKYKYVVKERDSEGHIVDVGEYYVYIDDAWVKCTDDAMLEELAELRGYCFKPTTGTGYYKMLDQETFRIISDNSWKTVKNVVTDGTDLFGNEYLYDHDTPILAVMYFYKAENEYRYVSSSSSYQERVATSDRWIACASAPAGTYHKDSYGFCYLPYKEATDTYGLSTVWDHTGSSYTILRLEKVYDTSDAEKEYHAERTTEGSMALWTYYDGSTPFYMEVCYNINAVSPVWTYFKYNEQHQWEECRQNTNLYLKDTSEDQYTKAGDVIYDSFSEAVDFTGHYDDDVSMYKSTPDCYVMIWIDGIPYFATVKYGSAFNSEDPQQSSSEIPKNILDYAQERVQIVIGDDQFIRWQAFSDNDPSKDKSYPVYSDTMLTSSLIDLDDKDWHTNMPIINLYALTAKVAINLNMDKNVQDASAVVAAPSSYLVFPTPTNIEKVNGEYFDDPCPYHPDNYAEMEGDKYVMYTDGIVNSDGSMNYYYKVAGKADTYITEDGKTILTWQTTYYSLSDDNICEYHQEYREGDEDYNFYYVDTYGNVYKVGNTDPDAAPPRYYMPDASQIIKSKEYTANTTGVKYKIDAYGNYYVVRESVEIEHEPISGYYYMDGSGNRYVRADEDHFRMIDWSSPEFGYILISGTTYTDDIGMRTIWDKSGDVYTLIRCEMVYEYGQEDLTFWTEKTINPEGGFIMWTYYKGVYGDTSNPYYQEHYNPHSGVWSYFNYPGGVRTSCEKNNDFYITDSEGNHYVKYNVNDVSNIGKGEWALVERTIDPETHLDQFGNYYGNGSDEPYRIVYLFEDEFYSTQIVTPGAGEAVGDWIVYDAVDDAREYLEHKESLTPDVDEISNTLITLRAWDAVNNRWSGWNGSTYVDSTGVFREYVTVYKEGYYESGKYKEVRELQRYIPAGPQAGWTAVYWEKLEGDVWHYFALGSGSEPIELDGPMVIFYYKDEYSNHYASMDRATFTCVEGSTTYYKFDFKLNEASRNGYKLVGWHNTHVNADDAQYPSSGNYRTLKLFYHDDGEHVVVSKEVLESKSDIGEAVRYVTINYVDYNAESSDYSYHTYKGKDLPRIDNPVKMYNVDYLAKWAQMDYTVTISDSAHGNVNAFLVEGNGERILITGGGRTVHYGDRIELTYSPNGVYQFSKWIITGEYEVEDETSSSTTLIIHGNCSISVSDVGERVVTLPIRFDAGILSEYDRARVSVELHNTMTDERILMQNVDHTGAEVFRQYVPINSDDPNEEYEVYVKYLYQDAENEEDKKYESYLLKGTFRVEKDNNLTIEYDIISARIMEQITVYDGGVATVYTTNVDGQGLGSEMSVKLMKGEEVVAQVTRYVGVMTSYLEGNYEGYIINNPYNEVPAVQISIKGGFEYLTFEGFPDTDAHGNPIFNLNRQWNYHAGYTYEESVFTFDLNWTRTDAPADILVQLKTAAPKSYEINYVAYVDETPYSYSGSSVSLGDNIASQLSSAKTNIESQFSAASLGKSIQGWYFDSDFQYPIQVFDSSYQLTSSVISKLEENKSGEIYRIYAKAVDTSIKKDITVTIKEEDKSDKSSQFTLVDETDEIAKEHGLDISDTTYSSSIKTSGRYDVYLSGETYESATANGTAYFNGYNGITISQTWREGRNVNLEITGKTINNTNSSHGITEWSAIKGYGFFDISLRDLDISASKYVWVYEKSSALSLLPSGTTWAKAVDGQVFTESIRSYQFSDLKSNTFSNDLHILLPQDGTDVVVILYISDSPATGTFDTNKATLSSLEMVVYYTIRTTSLRTELNLDAFAVGQGHNPTSVINTVYSDWAFIHQETPDKRILSGSVTKNVMYAGTNIELGSGFTEDNAMKHGLSVKIEGKYNTPKMLSDRANHKLTNDGTQFETDMGTVTYYMYNNMTISQKSADDNDYVMEAVGAAVNNVKGNYPVSEWANINGYGFFDISLKDLNINESKYVWVYEKSTALSLLPSTTTWANAVTGQIFTESIRSYQFSDLDEDTYLNDLHFLIPQDGTDITIVVYISDSAATGTFSTDVTTMADLTKILSYTIKTTNLYTEVDLDKLGSYAVSSNINTRYKDWTLTVVEETKTLGGSYEANTYFLGQNLTVTERLYGGKFVLDLPEGYHIVDDGSSPYITVSEGTVYNILKVYYKDEKPVYLSINLIDPGSKVISVIVEYEKNTVVFHVDRTTRDSYETDPWTEDNRVFKYGQTVTLPDVRRDGQLVTGWTSSPNRTITASAGVYTYVVGAKDSGTITITPHYDPDSFWTVTFVTPKGVYSNGAHSYSLDVIKNGTLRIADIPVPDITGIEGYTYVGYGSGVYDPITGNVQFSAIFDTVNHDLMFKADVNGHCEVSASNDSSDVLLDVGGHNNLQHHSEISVTIKPAKGRTIALNETRDWAYKRENVGSAISPTISDYYDQFKNKYTGSTGGDLEYSIVWMYDGANTVEHTTGYYTQYKIVGSNYYVNSGESITYDPNSSSWQACSAIHNYVYLEGTQSTSTHVGNKFLLSNTNEYKKTDDGKYQKVQWVKFTEIGEPDKLSNDRGFLWTFFLDSDLDLVFHTTEVSVNINFVVNGVSIDDSEHYMKVWGTGDKSSVYYLLGNNIPMYEQVVFYGYDNSNVSVKTYNDSIRWYRDKACTIEYPSEIVDGHRQYAYLATDDLTLYTNEGYVTTYLKDNNGDNIRGYLLEKVDGKITLGDDKGTSLDGYIFAGWGTIDGSENNVFQYAPNSTFDYAGDRLNLYAYYLKGGSDTTIAYDGRDHIATVELCTSTGGTVTQDITEVILAIEYTEEGGYGPHRDVSKWTVDYNGTLRNSTTGRSSLISGSMTYEITKVTIYVIAPSATFLYEEDNLGHAIEHYVSSDSIQVIAATPDGSIPNPNDIAGIVLDTDLPGYTDHASKIGSYRTAALVLFAEGKAEDYIVHYVDGAIVIYPEKTGRYAYGGY